MKNTPKKFDWMCAGLVLKRARPKLAVVGWAQPLVKFCATEASRVDNHGGRGEMGEIVVTAPSESSIARNLRAKKKSVRCILAPPFCEDIVPVGSPCRYGLDRTILLVFQNTGITSMVWL